MIDESLRAALLRRRDADQHARFAYLDARGRGEDADWASVKAVDDDNLAFLIEVVGRHGWRGSDQVGIDGARACWLLVQHAPQEHQETWLLLMERAVRDGTADAGDLVYLQDRVNMRRGRPQTHGSQWWGRGDDEVRLWPVVEPDRLNARRAEVALPPLDEHIISGAWTWHELSQFGRAFPFE